MDSNTIAPCSRILWRCSGLCLRAVWPNEYAISRVPSIIVRGADHSGAFGQRCPFECYFVKGARYFFRAAPRPAWYKWDAGNYCPRAWKVDLGSPFNRSSGYGARLIVVEVTRTREDRNVNHFSASYTVAHKYTHALTFSSICTKNAWLREVAKLKLIFCWAKCLRRSVLIQRTWN